MILAWSHLHCRATCVDGEIGLVADRKGPVEHWWRA